MLRYSLKRLFAIATVICLGIGFFITAKAFLIRIWEGPTIVGIVASQSDWPKSLQQLLKEAEEEKLNLAKPTLYHINSRHFFLQCTASESELFWLKTRLDLTNIDSDFHPVTSLFKLLKKTSCSFPKKISTKFYYNYTSENTPLPGEEDDRFVVAYNKGEKQLLIRYYKLW